MSPGGHLVTTAIACAAVQTVTGSAALTAGIAAGGFLIDLDHVFDYVAFERQRDLRPAAFLRYYLAGRTRTAVLLLHSYEVLALLALGAGAKSACSGVVLCAAALHCRGHRLNGSAGRNMFRSTASFFAGALASRQRPCSTWVSWPAPSCVLVAFHRRADGRPGCHSAGQCLRLDRGSSFAQLRPLCFSPPRGGLRARLRFRSHLLPARIARSLRSQAL